MKRRTIWLMLALLILLATLGLANANAQTGSYALTWSTIDSGGGTSSGGDYSLSGAIGQPDAGSLNGGNFTLAGGFWVGGFLSPYRIYLPVILR